MIRRRVNSNDGGFNLAEMLVVVVLMSIVMGSIATVVVTSLHKQNDLANRGTVLAQMRNALAQVDRDIRSANPLCYATGTRVVMLQTYDVGLITDYSVSGTKLVYKEFRTATADTTTTPNSNPGCIYTNPITGATTTYYEVTPVASRTVVYDLTAGSAPFTVPSAPTLNSCPAGSAPAATSTAAAKQISALTVKLSVKSAKQHTPVFASDCGIRLRNYVPTS
jgi:prepilin-type N-terminal cleavage/methylation domain-containing protein